MKAGHVQNEDGSNYNLDNNTTKDVEPQKIFTEIDKNRIIVVGRELTKLHEEVIKGTAEEIYNEFAKRDAIKGEFAVIVCPNTPQRQDDKSNQEIC